MSQSLPDIQANTVFPFTRHGMVIYAEAGGADTLNYYVGELVTLTSATGSTGGFFQKYKGGEALAMVVDKHIELEATYNGELVWGVVVVNEPINRPSLVDDEGLLALEDRSMNVQTSIAGKMRQLSILVQDDIVLMPLWDSTDTIETWATLLASDIGSDVVASITKTGGAGDVGRSGAAALLSDQADPGSTSPQSIGRVVGVPVIGARWAYVHFKRVL